MTLTSEQRRIIEQIVNVFRTGSTQETLGKSGQVIQEMGNMFSCHPYFQPAMVWADSNGFKLPLSALVIYDSFDQSGGILAFLRKRFTEALPTRGGDEKVWITQYVDARQNWLATASNPELHPTVYRTKCFKREIDRNNWDLSQLPIDANGVLVSAL